jgi:hypothetical protein
MIFKEKPLEALRVFGSRTAIQEYELGWLETKLTSSSNGDDLFILANFVKNSEGISRGQRRAIFGCGRGGCRETVGTASGMERPNAGFHSRLQRLRRCCHIVYGC